MQLCPAREPMFTFYSLIVFDLFDLQPTFIATRQFKVYIIQHIGIHVHTVFYKYVYVYYTLLLYCSDYFTKYCFLINYRI